MEESKAPFFDSSGRRGISNAFKGTIWSTVMCPALCVQANECRAATSHYP